jgi:hypothetical protein
MITNIQQMIMLQVNFGDVRIPKNFDAPKPQKLEFLSGIHGVSSDPVVIVDSQTFLVPNFSYDGEAPGIPSPSLQVDSTDSMIARRKVLGGQR